MEKSRSFNKNFRFVKPLYKSAKINSENVNKTVPYKFDRTIKLCGDDFNVKTVVTQSGANVINLKRKISKEYKVILPGVCDTNINVEDFGHFKQIDLNKVQENSEKLKFSFEESNSNMLENSNCTENVTGVNNNKQMEVNKKAVVFHKVPDSWLRVYPAPKVDGETLYSVIVRCVLCQLGLATFLIIWTVIAVFVIHSFEGPEENKVALEFEKEQNQLVIDLATELRQITPLSPRWRHAIEKRIEDERQLAMQAVGKGARLKPGQFWDLPGTFLFAIYVMTALGFGAPVPQTLYGRTSALIYAILAISTHIYLMVNASTCSIVHIEAYAKYLRDNFCGPHVKPDCENKRDSPNYSRNSELIKPNKGKLRKNIIRCVNIIGVARCVPFATISYYVIGVISFGVLRSRNAFDTITFPLEFTTTGGLESVEGYVRILYGFYVEGAMCLLACSITSLRRHTSSGCTLLSETYRLYQSDKCKDCVIDSREKV